jgi:hypothetical protein
MAREIARDIVAGVEHAHGRLHAVEREILETRHPPGVVHALADAPFAVGQRERRPGVRRGALRVRVEHERVGDVAVE